MEQEGQYWRQVQCRAYRSLGNRLAALEALERGLDLPGGDEIDRTPGAETMLAGERHACLKAQMRLVLRAMQASLQAVLDTRPQLGEDVRLVEVVRVCGPSASPDRWQ